ncbi:MAG: hypothetical protein J6X39_04545 [Bacteroidales bacterium]|nr:hypothetical protein [Bacteroidales bacterium]
MRRGLLPILGLVVLILSGCGAAKSVSKVYTASVEFTESSAVVRDSYGKQMTVDFERQEGAVTTPVDTLTLVSLEGVQYCLVSYLNSYDAGKNLEYVMSMLCLEQGKVESYVFTGKNLISPSKMPDYRIEGVSNLNLVDDTPAMRHMASLAAADSRLVELTEDIYLTDKTIEWWLERNPKAMTSAKKFEIGSVAAESSLAATFSKARKETKGKYQCAAIDARGYTCLIIRNTSTGNHILVWAVPVCTNRQTQWYLKNFYFENETTLAMIYYKGNSMTKIRLNLGSRSISRS